MKRSFDDYSDSTGMPLSINDINTDALSCILTNLLPCYHMVVRSVCTTWYQISNKLQETAKNQMVIITPEELEIMLPLSLQKNPDKTLFEKVKRVVMKCGQVAQLVFDCFESYMNHMFEAKHGTPDKSSYDPNMHIKIAVQNRDLFCWLLETTWCKEFKTSREPNELRKPDAALDVKTYFAHMIIQKNREYVKKFDFWQSKLVTYDPNKEDMDISEEEDIRMTTQTSILDDELAKYKFPSRENRCLTFWMLVGGLCTNTTTIPVFGSRRRRDVLHYDCYSTCNVTTPQYRNLKLPEYCNGKKVYKTEKFGGYVGDPIQLFTWATQFYCDVDSYIMFYKDNVSLMPEVETIRHLKCCAQYDEYEKFLKLYEMIPTHRKEPYTFVVILMRFNYPSFLKKFLEYITQHPEITPGHNGLHEPNFVSTLPYSFLHIRRFQILCLYMEHFYTRDKFYKLEKLLERALNQYVNKVSAYKSKNLAKRDSLKIEHLEFFRNIFQFICRDYTDMDKAVLAQTLLLHLVKNTCFEIIYFYENHIIFLLDVLGKYSSAIFLQKTFKKADNFFRIMNFDVLKKCYQLRPEILKTRHLFTNFSIPTCSPDIKLNWTIGQVEQVINMGYQPTSDDVMYFMIRKLFVIANTLIENCLDMRLGKEIRDLADDYHALEKESRGTLRDIIEKVDTWNS